MELIKVIASGALVYFLLLPLVGWYRKVKKEMEVDYYNDRTK